MSRNDVILAVFAFVLVVFSLFVALVVPRRDPTFPGRNFRKFALAAAALVVAMLTAVEVLGETRRFEEAGGEEGPAATGTVPTGGGGQAAAGDPAAGKQVFTATAQPACSSCHTLSAAGSTAMIGPNLDDVLQGQDAAFIQESIVNPDAQIAQGFAAGIMPKTYGDQLDDKQLANLVAFLTQSAGGS